MCQTCQTCQCHTRHHGVWYGENIENLKNTLLFRVMLYSFLPSHKDQTSCVEMRNVNQRTYILSITRKSISYLLLMWVADKTEHNKKETSSKAVSKSSFTNLMWCVLEIEVFVTKRDDACNTMWESKTQKIQIPQQRFSIIHGHDRSTKWLTLWWCSFKTW